RRSAHEPMRRTKPLRRALEHVLYPFVLARGFVLDESEQPVFTTFRREAGATVHIFDIQWDKSGTPRFILNFGEAPAARGARHVWECSTRLTLQRKQGGSMACWFQLRRPLLQQLTARSREYTPDQVAHAVVDAFPEMEAWWASKTRGPHVHGID